MRHTKLVICWLATSLIGLTGCEPKVPPVTTSSTGTASNASKTNDDHKHSDDHVHAEHGPNGGHIAHFEPSDLHFEWTHDDATHTLGFHFEELVSAGKKIGTVEIDATNGTEKKNFKIEADPKAKINGSVFVVTSEELMGILGTSSTDEKGVMTTLVVEIDGEKNTCVLVDQEHDHGHKH